MKEPVAIVCPNEDLNIQMPNDEVGGLPALLALRGVMFSLGGLPHGHFSVFPCVV